MAQPPTDGLESAVKERHRFDALRREIGESSGTVRVRLEVEQEGWTAD